MLFFTFFVIPETAGVAWTNSTSFWQPSLFSPLPCRISRNKIKLKHLCTRYQIINKDGRLTRETNHCKTRDLKTNITQLFFSRKFNELFKIYYYCEICTKDVSCSHGGASDLMRHCKSNSVTHQKPREK